MTAALGTRDLRGTVEGLDDSTWLFVNGRDWVLEIHFALRENGALEGMGAISRRIAFPRRSLGTIYFLCLTWF
ncbi:hypothetical protein CKO51_30330 [Rhodopirellula sp. SM50]|nr:hypothetical protein [Rhodopirellula sp. SM50]PAY15756.1 hypothetical protein CKO51_30330 [Rhodopirellula sp. SM50]